MSEEKKQPAVAAEGTEAKAKSKAKPRKSKKARGQVPQGKIYIQATFNNTIVTVCDMNGNALAWSSAGANSFKGPKKATPYAASVVVRDVLEKLADVGLKEANVYVSGVGQGREGALRALNAHGLNILTINDVTPVPHNGCRPPRPRRV